MISTKREFSSYKLIILLVMLGLVSKFEMRIFAVVNRKISTAIKKTSSVLEILTTKPCGSMQTIKGWVKSVRVMKNFLFVDLNDGSCSDHLQIVFPKKLTSKSLKWGSSINACGKVQINPNGQLELLADKIEVFGDTDLSNNYPFTPSQKQSFEYYRQYLHLRPQIEYFNAILRFRSAAAHKIHQYFIEKDFIAIHTPILTSNDCEGAGDVFIVSPKSKCADTVKKNGSEGEKSFFSSPAYLTVSGQLHLEALARSFSKVYTFNPSFRAENSKSRLHLSEFYMVEAEEAFVTDLKIILERIENLVKEVTSYLLLNYLKDIEFVTKQAKIDFGQHIKMLENLISQPFTVMTFAEAKDILKNEKELKGTEIGKEFSFAKEEELFLVNHNKNLPLFIIDWPKISKPFYMKECSYNKSLVEGVDLLVPNVGELCGGSLREYDYENLKEKLVSLQLLDSMQWYLDLRKFKNVPTGGFGMGFDRFLQLLLNIENIKDAIPFPRWPHNLHT